MSGCVEGGDWNPCPQAKAAGSSRCYFHTKQQEGLFGCTKRNAYGCGLPEGHRGNCDPVGEYRGGLNDADVFSDEQREISNTLSLLGAPGGVIRRAISKERT